MAGRGETDNRLFDWAREKNEPHYQEIPGAHARYDEFCAGFDAAVPDLTGPGLVEACLSARP